MKATKTPQNLKEMPYQTQKSFLKRIEKKKKKKIQP